MWFHKMFIFPMKQNKNANNNKQNIFLEKGARQGFDLAPTYLYCG